MRQTAGHEHTGGYWTTFARHQQSPITSNELQNHRNISKQLICNAIRRRYYLRCRQWLQIWQLCVFIPLHHQHLQVTFYISNYLSSYFNCYTQCSKSEHTINSLLCNPDQFIIIVWNLTVSLRWYESSTCNLQTVNLLSQCQMIVHSP